jgi:hypothetical protein
MRGGEGKGGECVRGGEGRRMYEGRGGEEIV